MEHYVTLFDSLFLPQGLCLHTSMQRHINDFKLWILCLDNDVFEVLKKMELPNVRLLELSKLETNELLAVKPMRSAGEYCWTLTPFAPKFVFDTDLTINRVTYLDADMWFRKSPDWIFEEFEKTGKQVLITDHAYAPEHDQSVNSGQYCVQFIIFTRTGGEVVRKWWERRCLEWCYARVEHEKFGDQKYLDQWPIKFSALVHVLSNKELLLAPWNATRFPYGNSIAWHFQGLRLSLVKKSFYVHLGGYTLPEIVIKYVYQPYIQDFKLALHTSISYGAKVRNQIKKPTLISQLRYKLSPWLGVFKKLNRTFLIKI